MPSIREPIYVNLPAFNTHIAINKLILGLSFSAWSGTSLACGLTELNSTFSVRGNRHLPGLRECGAQLGGHSLFRLQRSNANIPDERHSVLHSLLGNLSIVFIRISLNASLTGCYYNWMLYEAPIPYSG